MLLSAHQRFICAQPGSEKRILHKAQQPPCPKVTWQTQILKLVNNLLSTPQKKCFLLQRCASAPLQSLHYSKILSSISHSSFPSVSWREIGRMWGGFVPSAYSLFHFLYNTSLLCFLSTKIRKYVAKGRFGRMWGGFVLSAYSFFYCITPLFSTFFQLKL